MTRLLLRAEAVVSHLPARLVIKAGRVVAGDDLSA